MFKSSLALSNLRGFTILNVLAFHSFAAYLATRPAAPQPFDSPPFAWTGRPIVDGAGWVGFDLYCAFQYLYLMHLMFFLSGLFVWSSLVRKGGKAFLYDRLLRLGVPFLFGCYVLMPVAYYPAYRAVAVDPSLSAFWSHWSALPLWPSGPMWFLWFLLALDIAATGLFWIAPRAGGYFGRLSAKACARPGRAFVALAAVLALAYVPPALVFDPWEWSYFGPFGFQPSFAAQYVIYFFVGLGIGANGLEHDPFGSDGVLARHWRVLTAGAFAAFLLWIIPTALIVWGYDTPGLPIVAGLGLVLSSATACLGLTATFLRFAGERWPLFNSLSENAYGIYFVHYVFVVWLQYLLLGMAWFAVAKAAVVFTVALGLSWGTSAAICRIPFGARVMRATPRSTASAP
jgi:peptidoglycan/LPS O-acetylase OafA/YrhL